MFRGLGLAYVPFQGTLSAVQPFMGLNSDSPSPPWTNPPKTSQKPAQNTSKPPKKDPSGTRISLPDPQFFPAKTPRQTSRPGASPDRAPRCAPAAPRCRAPAAAAAWPARSWPRAPEVPEPPRSRSPWSLGSAASAALAAFSPGKSGAQKGLFTLFSDSLKCFQKGLEVGFGGFSGACGLPNSFPKRSFWQGN